jgi:hypothetical protein
MDVETDVRTVLVVGDSGVGKDTFTDLCERHLHARGIATRRYALAAKLKDMLTKLADTVYPECGVTRADFDDRYAKEHKRMGPLTLRQWMKAMASEVCRAVFGADFWTRQVQTQIVAAEVATAVATASGAAVDGHGRRRRAPCVYFVTDVRMPDELDWFRQHMPNCVAVRITRPRLVVSAASVVGDTGQRPHETEVYVNTMPVDAELENGGTLEDLDVVVQGWLRQCAVL